MKAFFLAPLALFALTPSAEEVGTSYSADEVVRVTTQSTTTTELLSTVITFDGEEIPSSNEDAEPQITVDRMEYVDRVLSVDGGRRTALERSFESIEESEENDEGQTDKTGVLDGRVIRIEEDDEGEAVVSLADDGDEVDPHYLEGFRLLYDEELLLPEGEVEAGDSWTIGGEAARRYFGLLDGANWFEEEEDDDSGPDFESLFAEELGGEVTVTYSGREEYDEREVWAFAFELEMDGSVSGLSTDDIGMGDGEENPMQGGEVSLEANLAGEGAFMIDCDTRCLVHSNGEGDVNMSMSIGTDMGSHKLLAELEMLIRIEGITDYESE